MEPMELWPRPVDGLYVTLTWHEAGGWSVVVVHHVEGLGWNTDQRASYDRLTLPEAMDVVCEEVRARRGF